ENVDEGRAAADQPESRTRAWKPGRRAKYRGTHVECIARGSWAQIMMQDALRRNISCRDGARSPARPVDPANTKLGLAKRVSSRLLSFAESTGPACVARPALAQPTVGHLVLIIR